MRRRERALAPEYGTRIREEKVERRGKSSPDGVETPIAVNSIRSNAVEGRKAGPAVPGRRLERAGDGASR